MAELPIMNVAHVSPGRIRLRAIDRGADAGPLLSRLSERLSQLQAVREVRVTSRTGSLLVLCEGEPEPVIECVRNLKWVELKPVFSTRSPEATLRPPRSAMLRLQRALEQTDERIAERTQGALSLDKLVFMAGALAGLWQLRAGKLLPAGTALFEYALSALSREAERERRERGRWA